MNIFIIKESTEMVSVLTDDEMDEMRKLDEDQTQK